MIAFLALFGDAWRRARDRRSVGVLLFVAALVAAFCASLEFTNPDPRESLKNHLENFSLRTRHGPASFGIIHKLRRMPRVDARAPAAEDDLPLGLDHVAVADLEIADLDDFDGVARALPGRSGPGRPAAPRDRSSQPLTARQRMDAIAGYLRDRGWETVITRARDDAGASLFVAASTEHLSELEGKWRFKLLFGAGEVPIDSMTPAEVVIDVQRTMARLLAGMFGMLVLLLAFGGTLPDLMQKGSLDLLLARPIGRARLLLFTYAGAVLTVLLVTAVIYGVCAVTLSLRSGHFSWAFVACALPTTTVFAAVFPVAMLVGVVTRHGNFAALAALACYGAADVVASLRTQFVDAGVVNGSMWKTVLEILWWITLKTGEIATLGVLRLGRSELSAAGFERFRQQFPAAADALTAYGTTALFAAFFLGATILLFRRRDF